MFFKRALSTFTLGPLALLLVYWGGWAFFVPVAIILLIAAFEYSHIAKRLGWKVPLGLLLPGSVSIWLLAPSVQAQLLGGRNLERDYVPAALAVLFFGAMAYALWDFERHERKEAISDWAVTVMGILFIGWLGSHFFLVRGIDSMAVEWTSMALLGTWIADSAAYAFGKRFGKRKLAPRLSPNKTVVGYVAGLVGGTALLIIVGMELGLPASGMVLLGLLSAGVSPLGDLGISLLKRTAGVKDSGTFLPGHGGALDRIDSLVWSVAFAYYLAMVIT